MAGGKTTEGLERLDQLGWLHEGKGDYLRQAAAAYIEATGQCEALDRCIAIAPTWEENHCLTEAIRHELKQRGKLGSSTTLQVHDPLDWTRQQKAEARNYRPGMILTLTKRVGGLEPSRPLQVERVHAGRLYLQGQTVPFDPARHADRLQVAIPRQTELAAGDPILIRRNGRKHGLINGEVLTCKAVQSDGSILTREGKTLPASFRDFAHGYVVTSHKSQGRTHDQVIIAAAQMDAKAAYVACSRGRHQVSIFTPDKAQLFERAEQSGDRLAASDVLDPTTLRPAVWQQQEQRAWQHAVEQASVLRRISERPVPTTELESTAIHPQFKEPAHWPAFQRTRDPPAVQTTGLADFGDGSMK